mmetsp:Transcript_23260/g.42800  ORF Transcript_23260/g.42800 Transcript_23260/m.42800 type:complete len:127 (-) Transcript_23260:831-1211(-)
MGIDACGDFIVTALDAIEFKSSAKQPDKLDGDLSVSGLPPLEVAPYSLSDLKDVSGHIMTSTSSSRLPARERTPPELVCSNSFVLPDWPRVIPSPLGGTEGGDSQGIGGSAKGRGGSVKGNGGSHG